MSISRSESPFCLSGDHNIIPNSPNPNNVPQILNSPVPSLASGCASLNSPPYSAVSRRAFTPMSPCRLDNTPSSPSSPNFGSPSMGSISTVASKSTGAFKRLFENLNSDEEDLTASPSSPPRTKKQCTISVSSSSSSSAVSSSSHSMHGEIRQAYEKLMGIPPAKVCPEAPQRPLKAQRVEALKKIPFVKNALETQKLIENQIFLKKYQPEEFAPFSLEIGPGHEVVINDIQFLSKSGKHSQVYLCEVKDHGKWVLKIFKDQILSAKLDKIVDFAAYQLCRYAQNMKHPLLSQHMAKHWNFDFHLEAVSKYLEIADEEVRHNRFIQYVKDHVKEGFLLVEYIPEEIPLGFNKEQGTWDSLEVYQASPLWQKIKMLFEEGIKAGITNDLRRSNVRFKQIDIDGQSVQVPFQTDVLEEEALTIDCRELRKSFVYHTNALQNQEIQNWLCSQEVLEIQDKQNDLFP